MFIPTLHPFEGPNWMLRDGCTLFIHSASCDKMSMVLHCLIIVNELVMLSTFAHPSHCSIWSNTALEAVFELEVCSSNLLKSCLSVSPTYWVPSSQGQTNLYTTLLLKSGGIFVLRLKYEPTLAVR